MSRPAAAQFNQKSKTLNDKYLLGDEIGKGGHSKVYKGLDLENGDFVAIKQVSLENIFPEDLASIMQEIDLLKNLNHKNIVKYLGSIKTKSHLFIILEYVENGSLASIIKPNIFGPFPERVVAVYIAQVLEGLVYLHEQGVIHRDIKGANILTTKEGLVKLADFGVATKLTEADNKTDSVAGTPYWMAPEAIEMSGVSASSDIWSMGCTVIELLTCVPPYYDLQPMTALFRIVKEDHPPIPEHLSPLITDFLFQCFQKDAKLRPDAKTLLKHPWIQNSRRASYSSLQRTEVKLNNPAEEISNVMEKKIEDGELDVSKEPADGHTTKYTCGSGSDDGSKPPSATKSSEMSAGIIGDHTPICISHQMVEHLAISKDGLAGTTDTQEMVGTHDSVFATNGIPAQPSVISVREEGSAIARTPSQISGLDIEFDSEDQSSSSMQKTSKSNLVNSPNHEITVRSQSVEITRLIGLLKLEESEDSIIKACQSLVSIFIEFPEKKLQVLSQLGAMPFIELLEMKNNCVFHPVLQVINQLAKDNSSFQESACLAGLIPIIMSFTGPECSKEMRMQAAYFIQQLCQTSSQTLQMFIACRGLPVLVGFLEPDYAKYREMVHIAIDGMWQVFKLQSRTRRNDFCCIFSKNGVLIRLVNTLHSLNEATRLASAIGVSSASVATENGAHCSWSGPFEPSHALSGHVEAFFPCSGQLDTSRVCAGQGAFSSVQDGKSGVLNSGAPFKSNVGQTQTTHLLQVEQKGPFSNLFEQVTSHKSWSSLLGQQEQPLLFRVDRENFDLGQPDSSPLDVDQTRTLLGTVDNSRKLMDRWHSVDLVHHRNGHMESSQSSQQQQEQAQPLLSLLEKDPSSKPVSGPLEYMRNIQGGLERHESILPLLPHASAIRKNNGELDLPMSAFEDNREDKNVIELAQENLGLKISSNLARPVPQAAAGYSPLGKSMASTSGPISQFASGLLSVSGVLNGRAGSATSSGLLSRMVSTLNADVAREYLEKVADLLLEFSLGDTTVKAYMCSLSLLIRLFQMLNKLEPPILLRILKCIKQLSTDPCMLEHLQQADAMKHLVPFLEWCEEPMVSEIHNQVLNALCNLCKLNKRRQERAAESGIIPHLMHFIKVNSPLKQIALPLLCDMAHASRYTREQLQENKGLELYLSLLDDEYWAVTALDSLSVCLALDNEQRKVEQTLLKSQAINKLVIFFQSCEQPFVHILEPFLKIITKSSRINVNLAASGLTSLLVARLDHQDAIARLNLLKLIKAVYEHHPRPKQLIVEHDLQQKLQRLIEERRDGEHVGGQVLVKQMATSLVKALHINCVL